MGQTLGSQISLLVWTLKNFEPIMIKNSLLYRRSSSSITPPILVYFCPKTASLKEKKMMMARTLLSIASPQTTILLVVFIKLIIAAMVAALPGALPGCPEACGNITVPYPFGIGQGCFRAGFNLTCDETRHPPKLLIGHNIQVLDISLPNGTVHINSTVVTGSSLMQYNGSWSAGLMDAGPLVVSTRHNLFVAIGCDVLASLVVNHESLGTPSRFASICAAMCSYGPPDPGSIDNTSCSGVACCQISISQGSPSYGVQLKNLDQQADSAAYVYGAAFIVDAEWFSRNEAKLMKDTLSFLSSDPNLNRRGMGYVNAEALNNVPTVLEWILDAERDDDILIPDPVISGLRCISLNSTAVFVGPVNQLRCDCSDGFHGNPYIINGCQGTNRAPCFNSSIDHE